MSWFIPREIMSTQQKLVLDSITKKKEEVHWIQGFAGTGKTLVLVNLMKEIKIVNPDARICFITFTHSLKDLVKCGFEDEVEILTHTEFLNQDRKFQYVFLDEVQDIKAEDLYKIKTLSGYLQIAGDPDQNIYSGTASDDQILQILNPETWHLKEIFRLTKILKEVALSILPEANLVEGNEARQLAQAQVRLFQCEDYETECCEMYDRAKRGARPDNPSVILFPTHKDLIEFSRILASELVGETLPKVNPKNKPNSSFTRGNTYADYNDFWDKHDLPISFYGNGWGSFSKSELQPIVYFMTMHSSKGLDFKTVCIPNLNSDVNLVSEKVDGYLDLEKRLLFVAITRSRKDLFLSYTSRQPHPLLRNLPDSVTKKYVPKRIDDGSDDDYDDEDII